MVEDSNFDDSDEERTAVEEAETERYLPLDDTSRNHDMMAVIVVDEIPNKTISQFFDANARDAMRPLLWLTGSYENLPEYTGKSIWGHTEVDSSWRSPFIGKTLDELGAFVTNAPVATKAITRNYFAVLKKGSDDLTCELLICKTPNEAVGRTEVQSTKYQADKAGTFHSSFDEDNWQVMMEEQAGGRASVSGT